MEVPESSTVGLGARKKWRKRRRGVEKIHGSGVVDRVAVTADQGACTKKIMRETGIRDDIAVDRCRFIWELKYTRRRTIDGEVDRHRAEKMSEKGGPWAEKGA